MPTLRDFQLQAISCGLFEALTAIRGVRSRSAELANKICESILSCKALGSGWLLVASLGLASAIGCGVTSSTPKTVGAPPPTSPTTETCNEAGNVLPGGNPNNIVNLVISAPCVVDGTGNAGGVAGSYVYGNVNILNGGSLTFNDVQIDFHAHSILVEKGGTLQAGATSPLQNKLTIWLWGGGSDDKIPSITCLSDSNNRCGVSEADWNSNPNLSMKQMPTMPCTPASQELQLPNNDCFYQYDVLESGDIAGAYFGKKVLAVSAGGSLILRGAKGMRQVPITTPIEANPADSRESWARLKTTQREQQ